MKSHRSLVAMASMLAIAGAHALPIPEPGYEPEPGSARNKPSGSKPVAGGGAKERARRAARLAKEQPSMKDSPFWPFGPAHPDDVPYVLRRCPCGYCMEQTAILERNQPDCAAVWNFDGFKRELQKQSPYVKAIPATSPSDVFMGLKVIVDDALAPGTVELRAGKEVVRVINLNLN